MTNHFHLLLYENHAGGISKYMQRLLNSYARHFNVKYHRQGSLFVGPFRAVWVDNDDQLLHVSRYIHLNPYVAHLIADVFSYQWSSLAEYTARTSRDDLCHTELIRSMMKPGEYRNFVTNQADFARSLADIQHLLLEQAPEEA